MTARADATGRRQGRPPGSAVACFALALLLGAASIRPAAAVELPQAKVDAIERVIAAFMAKSGTPGLSIAIVTDGKLSWSNGYGMADIENAVPARSATAYRTASIGKTMTATAALQLVDAGKLGLDADIRTYCPAFPSKRWRITPRNLLTHTSGIRHYGGPRDQEEQASAVHYPSVVAALAPFKDDPLLFEPGTKFLYSTYGYDVLGCVIEGAAGAPFLTYMRSHIWEPAGMTATRDDDPAALVPNRAGGYTRAGGDLRKAPMVDMSNRLPAGGYITTVVDLARFAEAILGDRLVGHQTFQRMITPAVLTSGKAVPYGFGWAVELEAWHGDAWVSHGGSSPGASGILVLMPGHRYALAVLMNLDEVDGRGDLAEAVTRIVLDFGPPAK
jgi:serine beta-lactamase-like protein LACTB, mitochondrial